MVESRTEAGISRSRSRTRPALALIALLAAGAWAVLVLPYARSLWWLHARPHPPAELTIPVAGVSVAQLEDNFGAPRDGGRRLHAGIDIMAPAGTPVLATAPGIIIGNSPTPVGGIVLWILGSGRRLYYYAHMRDLASGMRMGGRVETGTPIGSVGNTGNAATTPPHLHFGIYEVTSNFYPLHYHPIDPYSLLTP